MTSFIKQNVDRDDVDVNSFRRTEGDVLMESSDGLTVHPVKSESPPPDGDPIEEKGGMDGDSASQSGIVRGGMDGNSASQSGIVREPDVIWFIKSEPANEEETLEEEIGTHSMEHTMEHKALLVTPKLEEPLLPPSEDRSLSFDNGTVLHNAFEHSGKLQILQDDQRMKPPPKEKSYCNLTEEDIPDYFMKGDCNLGLDAKKRQSKESMRVNSEADTDEKDLQCKHCFKTFCHRGNLLRHLRIHMGVKPFECTHCNMKCNQRASLVKHLRTHTGEKPFECNQCNKKFKQKGHLLGHLRVHTGVKPFECDHCHIKFSENRSLQIHLRKHTGEKPFECSYCHIKFSEKRRFQTHLRVHTGDRPFECSQCNKNFSSKGNLLNHLKIHTGEKPFECSQCNKKFSQKEHLLGHLRIHADERPFECNRCNKRFRVKGHLQTHLKMEHNGLASP